MRVYNAPFLQQFENWSHLAFLGSHDWVTLKMRRPLDKFPKDFYPWAVLNGQVLAE